jgi:hypothetical protein
MEFTMDMVRRKLMAHQTSLKALPLVIAFTVGTVYAEESSNIFSYSGFGTIGAVHSSSKDGDYVTSYNQTKGSGASENWSYGTDSKLGLQLNAQFTQQFSAVVQTLAQEQTNGNFSPRFEWANVQFAITSDLKMLFGRIALPTFMVSDTRLVGYSNPWMRLPVETYQAFTITNGDGGEVSYKMHFNGVNNTIQAFAGSTKVDVYLGNGGVLPDVTAKRLQVITDTVEVGALTVRAGYTRTDIGLVEFGFPIVAPSKVLNFGASYDPGTWFVQSEISRSKLEGLTANQRQFYVTGGYHLNNFTPYITYSQTKPDGTPPPYPIASYDQTTTSGGVRWDVMKNVDVKLQWDHIKLGEGNTGYFTNIQPGLAGSTVNVVGAAVDFVF